MPRKTWEVLGRYTAVSPHRGRPGRTLEAGGYSLLPPERRRERLDDIPAEAFPKPGKMPPVPDCRDGTRMPEPPNDLPKVTDLPD